MEHISNEEKAKDITKCLWFPHKCTEEDIQNMLMEMAQWKDEQHAKEKQQWVLKKLVEEVDFPKCNNIIDKVHGRGNLDVYEYIQSEQLILLAKQQLIDEACDTIKHLLGGYVIRNFNFGDSYDIDELIDDFKKAMIGE